ncbi:methyltransferase domain-containing protein [Sediminibacillus dalangtanensis]|uniref:Methyltransferase domain-containing protein n=1 Tax=Sediminibacillus dalangtanensis TaxID=2729421 RepID=A0ABX7VTS4_9BACI|nr:class I SAM-dependent methyltransferase [Sediminibacillus dalangtanensis]QTM98878.1 methyltransferase domain-containing protein [Sediminibacillus dalangtanensis]
MNQENQSKADVQAQFGKNAANYVTSTIHAQGKDLEKLKAIIDWTGEECVLDIATGGGHVANTLAPLVKKVTAVDLTTEILAVSRTFLEKNGHTNVEFMEADAEQLSFPDESFDSAVCRIAAHHFSNVAAFVQEAYRVLKRSGTFILIDNTAPEAEKMDFFYNQIEKRRDYSHQRALKKSEWVQMIEEQGFELEELYRFPKQFYFEKWCKTMDLPDNEKHALSKEMLQAPEDIKRKFCITEEEGKVASFQAEASLIKAIKR